jgi:predicted HicB family RNase H-like nuclease
MKYKDFEGSADIDLETLVCRGKILHIDDLVTYKANSPSELIQEFQLAVDDYLETCAQLNKAPQKPCKGQFNIRVTPELHRLAQRRATQDATSLNAVATSALESYLKAPVQEAVATHQDYLETETPYSAATNVVNISDALINKIHTNLPLQNASGSPSLTVNIPPMDQKYAH